MIREFIAELIEFALAFTLMALMWVGAEYVFEGSVHTSAVDTFFCAMLARFIQTKEV